VIHATRTGFHSRLFIIVAQLRNGTLVAFTCTPLHSPHSVHVTPLSAWPPPFEQCPHHSTDARDSCPSKDDIVNPHHSFRGPLQSSVGNVETVQALLGWRGPATRSGAIPGRMTMRHCFLPRCLMLVKMLLHNPPWSTLPSSAATPGPSPLLLPNAAWFEVCVCVGFRVKRFQN
jgi:hypothetical protein